jgi:serine/threonine protein kinase
MRVKSLSRWKTMMNKLGSILRDRYRLEKILGQGGMSSVYQATDENIGVPVAVKENLVLTEDYSRQFQREASILATLRHPNLPRVSDYFFLQGQGQYLVMDFIEGEDLRERIERLEQLPEREVILIGAAICDALMYLHQRQPAVIHRDIKPGNIKITPEGHVVLVDFGLVKLMEGNQQTTTGARAMTPGYSPPEQYGTGHTDERSDVYSLGATLYAALTGLIPEDGLSRLTGKAKLTPIRKKRSNISEKLAFVIEKALEIDPHKRYQSALDFRLALLDSGNMATIPKEAGLVSPPPINRDSKPVIQTGISQPVISVPISMSVQQPKKSRLWVLLILIVIFSLSAIYWQIRFNGVSNMIASIGLTSLSAPIPTSIKEPLPEITNTPKATIPEPTQIAATEASTAIAQIPTPIGGGEGYIVFASNRNNSVMQLWIMQTDGSKEQPITNLTDGACQPAWSPDGTKLAFISPCSGKKDFYEGARIFTMTFGELDSIEPLPISVDPSGDFDPAWSPDGTKIAFASLRSGNAPGTKEKLIHIYIYDYSDNLLEEITLDRWKDKQPVWSPDGKYIAFVRKVASNEIWWTDITGQNPSRFSSPNNQYNNFPTWSGDGKILFYTQQNTEGGIPYFVGKRIDDAGLPLEFRIPPSGQADFSPAADSNISPDGQWFVFERWPDGTNHDIYIATINGANLTQLTTNDSYDFDAVWQPKTK